MEHRHSRSWSTNYDLLISKWLTWREPAWNLLIMDMFQVLRNHNSHLLTRQPLCHAPPVSGTWHTWIFSSQSKGLPQKNHKNTIFFPLQEMLLYAWNRTRLFGCAGMAGDLSTDCEGSDRSFGSFEELSTATVLAPVPKGGKQLFSLSCKA